MKQVIIIGTGGHAKVVADIVSLSGDKVEGYLDDIHPEGVFLDRPILGTTTDYVKFTQCEFIVAIGNSSVREKIVLGMPDAVWYTAIHPAATISSVGTTIGEGTVVCANAVINPCATVGKHCIINTAACVEHDNTICEYVHISVGTKLAGHVIVGKHTWVGIGATVSNDISVCDHCLIGAGAVVVHNIDSPGTYIGVPAYKKY